MSVTDPWAGRRYPKVLHVIPSLAIGGTEGQLVGFIRRSSAPERHHVAVLDEPGALAEQVPDPPVLVGPVGRSLVDAGKLTRAMARLRTLMRDGRFDLIHAHLGLSELLVAATAPRSVPIVASRRGRNTGFDPNPVLKLVEGLGHRRVDVMICNAGYWAERLRAEDRWPPRVEVVYNAVDLERFARRPLPGPPPTVAVVANLKSHKGHERFLRAFARARSEVPEARAVLIGDGERRTGLEGLVASLGLGDAVAFAGQVEDPRPFVERAHLVALTSDHEGFPNSLLEAMALGRPVVATRVGGIPELVRDGEEGFLTGPAPGDVAPAIVRLLRDRALGERMGSAARARAEGFTWHRLVLETERVYRETLFPMRRRP